jgi:hypothetical protein
MFARRHIRWIVIAIAFCALVAISSFGVEAQCSMCRASLAGSNANFIRNFNIGVLVLLIPPVAMFCGIFVVLRRNVKSDTEDDG